MKKLFAFFIAIIMVLSISVVVCFADQEETIADQEENNTLEEVTKEEPSEEKEIPDPKTELDEKDINSIVSAVVDALKENIDETPATLWSRLNEAWKSGDIILVIVLACLLLIGAGLVILKSFIGKKIASAKNSSDEYGKNTIDKINELVTAYNSFDNQVNAVKEQFKEALDKVQSVEVSNLKVEGDVRATLANYGRVLGEIAQLFQTIYANSNTLSQASKDLVTAKTLEIAKTLEKLNEEENV